MPFAGPSSGTLYGWHSAVEIAAAAKRPAARPLVLLRGNTVDGDIRIPPSAADSPYIIRTDNLDLRKESAGEPNPEP